MKQFLKNNGLSLVFFLLFMITLCGQAITGLKEHNEEMIEDGGHAIGMGEYLTSGHFIQATFENWESEFFQMALYVVLTIFLFQKGSSESKDPDGNDAISRQPTLLVRIIPKLAERISFSICYCCTFCFSASI